VNTLFFKPFAPVAITTGPSADLQGDAPCGLSSVRFDDGLVRQRP
jgi:hypothetical protein